MKYLARVKYQDKAHGEVEKSYVVAGWDHTNFMGKAYFMFMKFFMHKRVEKKSIKIELSSI